MKTITKNLKPLLKATTFVLIMLISFNTQTQKELTNKEVEYVKSEFRKGMLSFVESVKPIYKSGMSYYTFKNAILGKSSKNITAQGDALLLKAYDYISKSTSSSTILKYDSGKELASAFKFVKLYNAENKSDKGDLILFGNTTGDTFPSDAILNGAKKCRWYQLFCHLGNFWDWLTSDLNGDGESNIEEAINILLMICEIFDCI